MENNILVVCNVESSQPVHLYFLRLLLLFLVGIFFSSKIVNHACPFTDIQSIVISKLPSNLFTLFIGNHWRQRFSFVSSFIEKTKISHAAGPKRNIFFTFLLFCLSYFFLHYLLFAYFWNAFGDWEILLKCPRFKRMNQKIFSYSLNSSNKNFVRSFIIPIGGKLCKERMVTLIKKPNSKRSAKVQKSYSLDLV